MPKGKKYEKKTYLESLFFLRQKEAEELRERMEREKRELQEFIGNHYDETHLSDVMLVLLDKDNKRMADKIQAENEERQKKEEEMKQRLKDAQEVRKRQIQN